MRLVDAAELARLTPYDTLIEALADAFRGDVVTPLRSANTLPTPAGEATLFAMPAWTGEVARGGGFVGVKIVSVFPGNGARGLPSVFGTYVLMSGESGAPLAVMDGAALTVRRTAAASALAARLLARADASRMVMVGAGALAPHLVRAHAVVRPIRHVTCWNRDPAKAVALAEGLCANGFEVAVAEDLERAVRGADLVSCATLATTPLVRGDWLRPGAHLDLVGAFTPAMCEADDAAVARARVFVDTREGALAKAGELVGAMARGVLRAEDVAGDLAELCRGTAPGRRAAEEITLFKSVGAAIEDLAAAMLVWKQLCN